MLIPRIGTDAAGGSDVSFQLQQVTFNSIREVLPDSAIEQACRDVQYSYRQRVLTPIVTMLHMILAAIWPEESFQASWELVWGSAVGAFPGLGGKSNPVRHSDCYDRWYRTDFQKPATFLSCARPWAVL